MIYLIKNDFENCYSFLPDGEDMLLKMPSCSQRYRAKPRLENWVAPKASFYASENYAGQGEQLPEITTWAQGNIVFCPKAYDLFKALLAPSGEFLPMLVGDDTYYMFNALYVIPEEGIDRSQSVESVDSGVHMGQDRILFREEALDGKLVFKSPTNKLSYSFVTEAFKQLYDEYGYSGLVFEKVVLR